MFVAAVNIGGATRCCGANSLGGGNALSLKPRSESRGICDVCLFLVRFYHGSR
jgi:hypothetical protein